MHASGQFFSGERSRQTPATLSLDAGEWRVRTEAGEQCFAAKRTEVSSRLAQLPRRLTFEDGSQFVTLDNDAVDHMLGEGGARRVSNLVVWLESNWLWAILALALTVGAVYFAFTTGLPYLARPVAASMPQVYLEQVDETVMSWLDDRIVEPTELSDAEQSRVADILERIEGSGNFELRFRKGIGANAMALPGGTIVVTDELVELAGNDNEILAVLAHEAGHVNGHHGMRNILQSAGVAAIMAWLVGDLSMVIDVALVSAPVTLQQLSYTRNFEREADAYAREVLQTQGASPACFAEILKKIEASHGARSSALPRYLLTHPSTEERAALSAGAEPCS